VGGGWGEGGGRQRPVAAAVAATAGREPPGVGSRVFSLTGT
jgi:hypothetical protein